MKIKINDIPNEGLAIEEKQNASELDLARDDLKFVTPVSLSVFIGRDKDEAYAHVSASGKIEAVCSRCLSSYTIDFKKDFDFSYDLKGKTTLDLTDDIRSEIILEYPVKPLCKDGCKGLCQVCGKNLNEGSCGHKTDVQKWNRIEKSGN
ncbi:MAG: YceD family protein [Candidatus Omnitrophica bacterium]|nr:YceD family protein [Candidatus Omnitrophota bacterium]